MVLISKRDTLVLEGDSNRRPFLREKNKDYENLFVSALKSSKPVSLNKQTVRK